MQFKEWLILSESIEINFDQFIEDLKTHARPDEDELKRQKIDDNKKKFIIDALKKKNQENKQYLKYLLGFSTTPASQHSEDYDRAIDTLIWFIQTNKLPKRQIEADGWFNTGKKANELIRQKTAILNVVSKSQEKRDKKAGISADLPLVAQSGNIKIFLSKKVMSKDELKKLREKESKEDLIKHPDIVARHKFLCRYGKGTDWCTASPDGDYHAQYGDRDIYVVQIDDKPAYQFMGCTKSDTDKRCQFHDEKNEEAKNIPIELAELIMKNLPDIGKFYPVVYLNSIKNQNDILNIFEIDSMEKLTDYNVFNLLDNATNPDGIAKLIIQSKKELTDNNVYNLLKYAKNKDEIAKLIIQYKKELTYGNVFNLLDNAKNKDEIAKLLGSENMSKLTFGNVYELLDNAENKDEIAKLIIQYKKELTDEHVVSLLHYAENKKEIAELLGSENISKLYAVDVSNLLYYATNKEEMKRILQQYGRNLKNISLSPTEKNHSSGSNLYSFASYAKKIMPTLLSWL